MLWKWIVALVVASGCGSGNFDHEQFEAVVARVRPLVVVPDRLYLFKLDDALDASSLRPMPDNAILGRGDNRGLVRAAVDANHRIAVSIETRDQGHAGEWGFVFVERGFDRRELELVDGESKTERIDDVWSRWHFDLD